MLGAGRCIQASPSGSRAPAGEAAGPSRGPAPLPWCRRPCGAAPRRVRAEGRDGASPSWAPVDRGPPSPTARPGEGSSAAGMGWVWVCLEQGRAVPAASCDPSGSTTPRPLFHVLLCTHQVVSPSPGPRSPEKLPLTCPALPGSPGSPAGRAASGAEVLPLPQPPEAGAGGADAPTQYSNKTRGAVGRERGWHRGSGWARGGWGQPAASGTPCLRPSFPLAWAGWPGRSREL